MNEEIFISKTNENVKEILEGFLDTKFFGVIYGKSLTGKTYFIKKFLDSQFVNYYYVDLFNQNLLNEISELVVDEYTILVIDNAQLLTKKDMEKVLYLYEEYKNLSVLLVGNEELKIKITKADLKSFLKNFNFILEWKELNFEEFKEFLKSYMSEKGISILFTKGGLKDFYKKSEGIIGKAIKLLLKNKNKKVIYRFNLKLFLFIFIIIFSIFAYLFYLADKNIVKTSDNNIQKIKPTLKDKKPKRQEDIKIIQNDWNKVCYFFDIKNPIYTINYNNKKEIKKNKKNKKYYVIFLGIFSNKNNALNYINTLEKKVKINKSFKIIKVKNFYGVVLLYENYFNAMKDLKMLKEKYRFAKIYISKSKKEREIVE